MPEFGIAAPSSRGTARGSMMKVSKHARTTVTQDGVLVGQWPEFVAEEVRKWLAGMETGTLYIEPGGHGKTETATASMGS